MNAQMSVAKKITLAFLAMLLLLFIVGSAGVIGVWQQYQAVSQLVKQDVAYDRALFTAQLRISKLRRDEKDIFLSVGDAEKLQEYFGKWKKSVENLHESFTDLRAYPYAEDKEKLDTASKTLDEYKASLDTIFSKITSGGFETSAAVNDAFEPGKKIAQKTQTALNDISKSSAERIKEVDGVLAKTKNHVIGVVGTMVGIAILLAVAGMFWLISTVRRPLTAMQQKISEIESTGRISLRVPVMSRDEIGQTSQAVNQLLEGMGQIIGKAGGNSRELIDAAQELDRTAERIANASASQTEATNATSSAIEELTVSVNVIADSARTLREETHSAAEIASKGATSAQLAAQEIEQIAAAINDSTERIDSLNRRSGEIGSIVMVIKEIADQTNLLALNAAIEAARAGETGRGFAVVADEVRKLAERTSSATTQINTQIEAVQNDTGSAAIHMQHATKLVESGVQRTHEVASALREIDQVAHKTFDHITEMASSIREQSAASEHIAGHISRIAQASEENHEVVSSANVLSSRLGSLARQLDESIQRFKV
jgi:methyl-accepting chemotaxis protein